MNRLACVMIAALAGSAGGAELPDPVFATTAEDEIQNIVFLGESHPVILRLRLRIDQSGFRVAWGDFVDRLQRFLDADGDGTLSVAEAQRGQWQQILRPIFGGPPAIERRIFARLGKLTIDSRPRDGQVSRDELARHLREALAFTEFTIQAGPPPDPRTQALFGLLDADGDGRLTDAELANTDALVARLDRDGNEMLDGDELRPDLPDSTSRQFFGQPQPEALDAESSPVMILDESTRSAVRRRWLEQYDRGGPGGSPKDRRLDAAELGLPPETLARFDRDQDGGLDGLEIEEYLAAAAPAAELVVSLEGPRPNRPNPLPKRGIEPRAVAGSSVRLRQDDRLGRVTADVGDAVLDLSSGDGVQNYGDFLEQQFATADADKNGYLDEKEGGRNGFINQFFTAADRDGDGKLFREEFDRYASRQMEAQTCRATLSITDCGRALFEIIDANRNDTLDRRELRAAASRLKAVVRSADSGISVEAIPRRYELAIARGSGAVPRGVMIVTYDSSTSQPPERSRTAPSWFRRMDRNADGDVSAREFLGPLAEFRRMDADADGLIDPEEAVK